MPENETEFAFSFRQADNEKREKPCYSSFIHTRGVWFDKTRLFDTSWWAIIWPKMRNEPTLRNIKINFLSWLIYSGALEQKKQKNKLKVNVSRLLFMSGHEFTSPSRIEFFKRFWNYSIQKSIGWFLEMISPFMFFT